MKVTHIEQNEKNHITITCEEKRLFGLKTIERKFLAISEYPKGYYDWVELPNRTMAGDLIGFQLDTWVRHHIQTNWEL